LSRPFGKKVESHPGWDAWKVLLMIVFNLACSHQHLFEGWFASSEDFESQRERGLVECPICSDITIEKRLSAPRLNLGASPGPSRAAQDGAASASPQASRDLVLPAGVSNQALATEMQSAWMEMAKQVLANTEDVGSRFAEEARRMHYRETPERSIRGQATQGEAEALREEGIPVASFALPAALKGSLQ
jgi:hypothetical protein